MRSTLNNFGFGRVFLLTDKGRAIIIDKWIAVDKIRKDLKRFLSISKLEMFLSSFKDNLLPLFILLNYIILLSKSNLK